MSDHSQLADLLREIAELGETAGLAAVEQTRTLVTLRNAVGRARALAAGEPAGKGSRQDVARRRRRWREGDESS